MRNSVRPTVLYCFESTTPESITRVACWCARVPVYMYVEVASLPHESCVQNFCVKQITYNDGQTTAPKASGLRRKSHTHKLCFVAIPAPFTPTGTPLPRHTFFTRLFRFTKLLWKAKRRLFAINSTLGYRCGCVRNSHHFHCKISWTAKMTYDDSQRTKHTL